MASLLLICAFLLGTALINRIFFRNESKVFIGSLLAVAIEFVICSIWGFILAAMGHFNETTLIFGLFGIDLLMTLAVLIINNKRKEQGDTGVKKEALSKCDVILLIYVILFAFICVIFSNEVGANGNRDTANYYFNALHIANKGMITFDHEISVVEDNYSQISVMSEFVNNGIAFYNDDSGSCAFEVWNLPFFSTVLAIGYMLWGHSGIFIVIAGISALTLLLIYGLVKEYTSETNSFAMVVCFSCSPAFLYASRTTLSEVICTLFIFLAISVHRYSKRSKYNINAIVFMLIAFTTAIRIDMYICVVGVILYLLVRLFFAENIKYDFINALIMAMAIAGIYAWNWKISPNYLRGHYFSIGSPLQLITKLYVGLYLLYVGLYIVRIFSHDRVLKRFRGAVYRRISTVSNKKLFYFLSAGATVIVFKLSYRDMDNLITDISYNVRRLTWYTSWIVIFLALVAVFRIFELIKYRERESLLLLTVIGVINSAVYLYRPSAADDQIWWSRRFICYIIPFLYVCAFIILNQLKYRKVILVCLLLFSLWSSRGIVFEKNAQGIIENNDMLATFLDEDEIYFSENLKISAIMMAGYGKNVYSLKQSLTPDDIKKYCSINDYFYYIGDFDKIAKLCDASQYNIENILENTLVTFELECVYDSVPIDSKETKYVRNIYKISYINNN